MTTINSRNMYLYTCSTYVDQFNWNARGKFYNRRSHEGSEGNYKYRSTISLTSALDVGLWVVNSTLRQPYPPGMKGYPVFKRPVWTGTENLAQTIIANHFEYGVVCCVVYTKVPFLGWCVTTRNVCVCCPFNNGALSVTNYLTYFKLSLIFYCHFKYYIVSVTTIIVTFNFSFLYYLPEDGKKSGRNM